MNTYPELALDRQLCFRVYRLHRAITARYRPLLEALGLTYPQYLVMLVLWEEGEVSLGRVGERLDLDSGTLSPLVKRLQARGLLKRSRSSTDERSLLLTLTAEGLALRDQARPVPLSLGACLGQSPVDLVRFAADIDMLLGSDSCIQE